MHWGQTWLDVIQNIDYFDIFIWRSSQYLCWYLIHVYCNAHFTNDIWKYEWVQKVFSALLLIVKLDNRQIPCQALHNLLARPKKRWQWCRNILQSTNERRLIWCRRPRTMRQCNSLMNYCNLKIQCKNYDETYLNYL